MEFLRFNGPEVSDMLTSMPAEERDQLPYGIIRLDENGTVLEFNRMESAITGLDASHVIGKNFFSEIAPCTKTPEFFGKFQEGLDKKFLNTVFDYVFDYNMAPVRVKVHMVYAEANDIGCIWILVKRVLR